MDFHELQQKYIDFIEERDWDRFHQPKNTAMALSVEAAELLELFQWKDNVDLEKIKNSDELVAKAEDEMADVLMYLLSLAHQLDIDLLDATHDKLDHNHDRYDPDTAEQMKNELEEWQR